MKRVYPKIGKIFTISAIGAQEGYIILSVRFRDHKTKHKDKFKKISEKWYMDAQKNGESPMYHFFIAPEIFFDTFILIPKIQGWLKKNGLTKNNHRTNEAVTV